VPFGELFPFGGFARKILDGQSTGVTTTHGIQVRSDFAEKYPELVVAYLKATLEADRLLRENPEKLSEDIAKWTGIDAEVVYAFHGPQAIQTRDYTLKPNTVHLTFLRIRISGSRLLVGPRDLRIGYPDIFRFTPLGPKRPFRCGTRI
jgi:NitT/TauT family transport system substrate-binding protein